MRPRTKIRGLGQWREGASDIHLRCDAPGSRRGVVDGPEVIAVASQRADDLIDGAALVKQMLRMKLQDDDADPAVGQPAFESPESRGFRALDIHLEDVDAVDA
jgi:hypothetical protein